MEWSKRVENEDLHFCFSAWMLLVRNNKWHPACKNPTASSTLTHPLEAFSWETSQVPILSSDEHGKQAVDSILLHFLCCIFNGLNMYEPKQRKPHTNWLISVNHSLAGSAGRPSVWLAGEGAQHPDSRSTAGSQDDTDSVDSATTELCTDALQQPGNHHHSPTLINSVMQCFWMPMHIFFNVTFWWFWAQWWRCL